MDTELNEYERIDDLNLNGYKIIQDKRGFCFGVDAVLLADFPLVKKGDTVCDLGCGTGIIPLLLCAKSGAKKVFGVEIVSPMAEIAQRNIFMNRLTDKMEVICHDLKSVQDIFEQGSMDVVTCNPPYKESGGGIKSESEWLMVARHEVRCNFNDVVDAGGYLLKNGGRLDIIHRPERLCDLIFAMRDKNLEPKRIRFIHPKPGEPPSMVLIEGQKGARPKVKVEKPLFIYDENGHYSSEINEIYGRGGNIVGN